MTLTLPLRPDVTVLATIVPEGANNFKFVHWDGINVVFNIGDRVGFVDVSIHVGYDRKDKEAEWYPHEIVGLLREIPEEQAAGLVAWEFDTCRDYTSPGEDGSYVLTNPTDALKSAIKANGGDPEQNWLLIKKIQ